MTDRRFISLSLYDSTRPDKPWSMRLLAKPLSFENLINVLGVDERHEPTVNIIG